MNSLFPWPHRFGALTKFLLYLQQIAQDFFSPGFMSRVCFRNMLNKTGTCQNADQLGCATRDNTIDFLFGLLG